MKFSYLLGIFYLLSLSAIAQQEQTPKKKLPEKIVDKTKEINNKSKEVSDASNEAAQQVKEAGENVKKTVDNIKAIVKVFEPIFKFHFKKNKPIANGNNSNGNAAANNNTNNGGTSTSTEISGNNSNNTNTTTSDNTNNNNSSGNTNNRTTANNAQSMYGQPESATYNIDGTMNMGHQNNGQFGNCLNLLEAKVMGMGEAEESPKKIDLIFFSQYGGLGYSFESPYDAPTINEGVDIKKWATRNETEIAETRLTLSQFEKITNNTGLLNAVKNTKGYAANFFTPNKMDGRVFAIKLMQDDKEVNALLAVYKQFGTGGSNGYLKIKIKVQGIDKNGDGNADASAYIRQ